MDNVLTVNELFAGIGAFRKALINLGIPHKIVGMSEIDKYAIRSYDTLYGKTRNYGDISKCVFLDYADLWTYGFPCQDISLAGYQRGINEDTRSGLLYQVQRLLNVSCILGTQPKYLIMENVRNLVSKRFMPDFERWVAWLDDHGYNTYWKVMNAADYGIPQKRERVIAVSIRKDIDKGFEFPKPQTLTTVMADYLEDKPDEKYYLSDAAIEYLERHNIENEAKGLGFRFAPVERERVCRTLTTRPDRTESNYILERGQP